MFKSMVGKSPTTSSIVLFVKNGLLSHNSCMDVYFFRGNFSLSLVHKRYVFQKCSLLYYDDRSFWSTFHVLDKVAALPWNLVYMLSFFNTTQLHIGPTGSQVRQFGYSYLKTQYIIGDALYPENFFINQIVHKPRFNNTLKYL